MRLLVALAHFGMLLSHYRAVVVVVFVGSYCDDRAMQFCKPMLDSGTLGAKGNTQVVVPRKTVHWGAYRDPPAKSIALCTLKSFP